MASSGGAMATFNPRSGFQGHYLVVAQSASADALVYAQTATAKRCHLAWNDDGTVTLAFWEAADAAHFRRLFQRAILDAYEVAPRWPVSEIRLYGDVVPEEAAATPKSSADRYSEGAAPVDAAAPSADADALLSAAGGVDASARPEPMSKAVPTDGRSMSPKKTLGEHHAPAAKIG